MSRGYVYILSNPSMPGLVKIGRTTRSVEQRANELWQTGVPTPFVIDHFVLTPNCEELEARMHDSFSRCRVNGCREFFDSNKADVECLRDELDCALKCQIEEFVEEYLGEMTINHSEFIVCEADTGMLAHRSGYHTAEVAPALACITPEELEPAMQRWQEAVAKRIATRDAYNERKKNEAQASAVVLAIGGSK